MEVLKQIKSGASSLVETLEEGWQKLAQKSGRALTRFTRREKDVEQTGEKGARESWGVMPGEVAETDSDVIIRLEAPGMEKEDFDVLVDRDTLRVRGEKRLQRDARHAGYHVFEAAYGSFERVLSLPCEVDPDRAAATYRRGVLTVRIPRAEGETGSRKIEIR